jgi:hypothetical protein
MYQTIEIPNRFGDEGAVEKSFFSQQKKAPPQSNASIIS